MVCDSFQIWVLIQDIVIDVQEKLERVLVQEVYLKNKKSLVSSLEFHQFWWSKAYAYKIATWQLGLELGSTY